MKKLLGVIALVTLLASPVLCQAEDVHTNPAGNPVDQFTGKYWMDSKVENQKAYLFGIDSAIAVEATIQNMQASSRAKSGKKPLYTLSPFEKGWMEAFRNMSRDQIVEEVTQWYKEHPSDLDRPVLSVIWHEIVQPRLQAGK